MALTNKISLFASLILCAAGTSSAASTDRVAYVLHNLVECNLDRRCLTKPDGGPSRLVTVESDGTLKFDKIGGSSSPIDDFYVEQSIWEVSPVTKKFAGATFAVGRDPAATLAQISDLAGKGTITEAPELSKKKSDDFVFLHLIPASAGGCYPAWINTHKELVHNDKNILKLRTAKLHDPRLVQFRTEWVNFFVSHQDNLTDAHIQNQVSHMRRKYSDFFG
jgi:hypothetical protein